MVCEDALRDGVHRFYAEQGIDDAPQPLLRPADSERCMPGEYDWRNGDPIVYTAPDDPAERDGIVTDGGRPATPSDDPDALRGRGVHEVWHALFDREHRVSAEKWQIYDDGPVEAALSASEHAYRAWLRDQGFKTWIGVQETVQPDPTYDRLYHDTRRRLHRWAGQETAERYDRLARLRGVDEYLARTAGLWAREEAEHAPRADWGAPGYLQYTLGHAAIHAVDGDALTGFVRDEGLCAVLDMNTGELLDRFTRPI